MFLEKNVKPLQNSSLKITILIGEIGLEAGHRKPMQLCNQIKKRGKDPKENSSTIYNIWTTITFLESKWRLLWIRGKKKVRTDELQKLGQATQRL